MSDDKYDFQKLPEVFYYEFLSEGPKGVIKKVVRYKLIEDSPVRIFNLGFGDLDTETDNINDKIKSNNKDRQKVLATVAETVIDFTLHHPDAFVFAQGSTPSRTRLYQMGIAAFYKKILLEFEVIGYVGGEWQIFENGVNYEAFLIKRK
ncbi:MAG: hypothetical protein KF746_13635 [Chitinophagaceae bacterium]|nr:hypothetical protein [Chitinophagaceae bacterium]